MLRKQQVGGTETQPSPAGSTQHLCTLQLPQAELAQAPGSPPCHLPPFLSSFDLLHVSDPLYLLLHCGFPPLLQVTLQRVNAVHVPSCSLHLSPLYQVSLFPHLPEQCSRWPCLLNSVASLPSFPFELPSSVSYPQRRQTLQSLFAWETAHLTGTGRMGRDEKEPLLC